MARSRIVDYRRVPASELLAHPRNWRRHPSSQRNALRAVLDEVGFAGALLAYERDGVLTLLDGHLRAKMDPSTVFPVVVVDVDDQEAALILATFDPVGGMAFGDSARLNELLAEVQSSATRFLAGIVDGVDLSFLSAAAASGSAAMAAVQGSTVPPGPSPPVDLFLRPGVDRETVKAWAVHLPKDRFAGVIENARSLAEAMGYSDDAAGLVMACVRLVADKEGVTT